LTWKYLVKRCPFNLLKIDPFRLGLIRNVIHEVTN